MCVRGEGGGGGGGGGFAKHGELSVRETAVLEVHSRRQHSKGCTCRPRQTQSIATSSAPRRCMVFVVSNYMCVCRYSCMRMRRIQITLFRASHGVVVRALLKHNSGDEGVQLQNGGYKYSLGSVIEIHYSTKISWPNS